MRVIMAVASVILKSGKLTRILESRLWTLSSSVPWISKAASSIQSISTLIFRLNTFIFTWSFQKCRLPGGLQPSDSSRLAHAEVKHCLFKGLGIVEHRQMPGLRHLSHPRVC